MKVTRNWLNSNFKRVQALDYSLTCKFDGALREVRSTYHNDGLYGWNYDVMLDDYYPTIAITAGYRPYGNNYLTPSDLRELHDCYGKISNWDWIDMLFSKIENA